MPEPLSLEILLHEQPIGSLSLLEGDRPVLSLSFKDRYGQLITGQRLYQTRLMPFFSNLLPEGPLRTYLAAMAGVKLAPAYDMVSTLAYIPDDRAALKVSRSARFDAFTLEELSHLAEKARLPRQRVLDTARETVQRFRQVWNAEKQHLPMASSVVERIEWHFGRVPLLAET